jgi:hypothetical protein
MYNLTVAIAHTFFVGDQQWLVHNTACAVQRQTTVLGRKFAQDGSPGDTMVAKDWPNHNVLDIPEYTWEKNVKWLDEAIERDDVFYLASNTDGLPRTSLFLKEIRYLKSKGYQQQGKYMVRVK